MNAPKLTEAQHALLVRLDAAPKGFLVAPGDFHGAHTAASAFWRTGRALERRGLAVQPRDGTRGMLRGLRITDAGRAVLRGEP